MAAGTPPGGIVAPVSERGEAGCIALIDGLPRYDAIMAAQRAGAVGVVAVSHGPERHYVEASPLWGAPTGAGDLAALAQIPAVQVSQEDGALLRARPGAAIRLVAEARREWRPVRMPVADIPGESPHFVMVGAHYCTWGPGATDNLAAVAMLIELARLFAAGPRRRHGLRFAFWTGHEHGGYAGSSWYADQHWAELRDHAIAYVNVDIVGVRGGTTKALRNTTAELHDFATGVLDAMAGPLPDSEKAFVAHALRRRDMYVAPTRSARNSDQSFCGIGVPSLQVSGFLPAASPEHMPGSGLAWWWQTEQDTPDRCDPAELATDTAIHHALVSALTGAEILPFDPVAMVDDVLASLREYAEAAPELAEIAWLQTLAEQVRTAAVALAGRPATDAAGRNALLMRVTRLLNPVLHHGSSNHDYDLGRISRLLPGLSPALGLAGLPPDESRMVRVGLRRRANRIADALQAVLNLLRSGE
nr:M28 family peptidase [Neoroseomonas alba]